MARELGPWSVRHPVVIACRSCRRPPQRQDTLRAFLFFFELFCNRTRRIGHSFQSSASLTTCVASGNRRMAPPFEAPSH
ncbi:hypothetical protein VTH06DRAFT_1217 [Thermothelomyces fergusii]